MSEMFLVAFGLGALFVTFRTVVIDYLLKGSTLMGLVEDIKAKIDAAGASVAAIDGKLDEVLAFIESLKAGGGATVEQLNELLLMVTSLQEHAAAVESEAAALMTGGEPQE